MTKLFLSFSSMEKAEKQSSGTGYRTVASVAENNEDKIAGIKFAS